MRSLLNRLAAVHARRTAAAALLLAATLMPSGANAEGMPSGANADAMPSGAKADAVPSPAPVMPPGAAATSATVTASLYPDRLSRRAALTVTIHYSGGEFGVPSPVRRVTVRFPAGLVLEIPKLESCSLPRLRAGGSGGCPSASRLGTGHALAVVRAGSQRLTESVALTAFLGPLHGVQPTLLILARGYTPLERRIVLTGNVLPAPAPYGEEIEMAIPAIPTLPLVPDASLATFSLTVGASYRHRTREQNAVRVPAACPAGGFPFAGEFTYADATNGSALATIPCPS